MSLPRAVTLGALVVLSCSRAPAQREVSVPSDPETKPTSHDSSDSPAATHLGTRGPLAPPLPVDPDGELARRPLLALYVRDPWASVLGAEVPSVVVYADGSAIVLKVPSERGAMPGFVEGRVADVASLRRAVARDLLPLPEHVSLPAPTDQPTTSIFVDTGEGWIRRGVYGMGRGCRGVHGLTPPENVVSACRALDEIELTSPRAYTPEEIEVMLWGYAHSPETPKPWPEALPTPPDVAPPKSGTVSHRIPGGHLPALRAFLASLAPRQAVLVHGHKWSVSHRVALPGDAYLGKVSRETQRAAAEAAGRK